MNSFGIVGIPLNSQFTLYGFVIRVYWELEPLVGWSVNLPTRLKLQKGR